MCPFSCRYIFCFSLSLSLKGAELVAALRFSGFPRRSDTPEHLKGILRDRFTDAQHANWSDYEQSRLRPRVPLHDRSRARLSLDLSVRREAPPPRVDQPAIPQPHTPVSPPLPTGAAA